MIEATAAVTINGLTVTISAHLPAASLARLCEDLEVGSSFEDRQELANHLLRGMPAVLDQAHDSLARNLLMGASRILQNDPN